MAPWRPKCHRASSAPLRAGTRFSGCTARWNLGSDDYLENLDFAGMLDFQMKKGKWSLLADVVYLDFSDIFSLGIDF
jgi:hypothetical protein